MAQEKLTIVIEPETRQALREWAQRERRPVANLARKIISEVVEEHRQHLQQGAAA